MQAIKISQHGSPAELNATDIPRPTIGPDDVLVEIYAAAINPSDVASAMGRFPDALLPRVLGRDFAGKIVEGPAELIGKEVWGSGGDLGITCDGTHAEYIVIPRAAAALKPNALTIDQAASVGVPYQTAWTALVERGAVKSGEWVVVSGATGAVGSAAIQLAAAHGAKVIALVRNQADEARLHQAKVSAVAHTETNDLAEVVRQATDGKGAELAINGVGGAVFQPLMDALAPYGRMVVFSVLTGREITMDLMPFYRKNLAMIGVNTATIDVASGAQILNKIAPLFDSGVLAPPPAPKRYPLSKAAEAYQNSANGKIVLIPDALFK